ncbi:MAG: hypothetical protein AB7S48_07555 [Bacteroidales bacterium]
MRIRCFFLSVLLFGFYSSVAQDVASLNKIPSNYDRSSVTLFYINFASEDHSSEIQSKVDKISFSDKYYNNNLDYVTIPASFDRNTTKFSDGIKQYLNDQAVGKQIISKWFARQNDGTMTMDLIFDRGMFNATDAAYIKAQSTKLGNAVLQDYGNRLIGRSYVLVLDYQSVKTMKESKIDKMKGWKSTVTGYLYKIKYTDETQSAIYDSWIYPEDSDAVKEEKRQKFEQIPMSVEFVTKTTVYVTASQPDGTTQLGKLIKQKSEDELLAEMVQKGYDESLYFLEKNYEDFMVKTTIYQVRPIRAKIGKKEGLKCDHRYFAYEYVYDEKTNSTKPVRRGVIRATSNIVDNRQVATGDMGTSKFYQTAGRKLATGYLLRQQNDYGLEFTVGYESGEVGGVYGRVDARLGRFVGIRSFFIYVEGGAETKEYYDNYVTFENQDISFYRYGAGLAKGFMLTRNIEFRPYIGVGQEVASYEDWSDYGGDLKVLYVKGGANLALNLSHSFQLIGGVGYYSFISNAENDNGDTEVAWEDIFKDRTGSSIMAGIKIMF